MEFTIKSTPKRNDEVRKLTASLSSVGRTTCSRLTQIRKKTTVVKLDSRTISMVVEAGSLNSITSSSSSSSSSCIGTSADHLITVNAKQGTDGDILHDESGNENGAEPIPGLNNKRRHSNWDASSGVGRGMFTESQCFRDSCHFSSVDEDDQRSPPPGAVSAGHGGRYETISLKELKGRWSYDDVSALQPGVRRCRSVGDLT